MKKQRLKPLLRAALTASLVCAFGVSAFASATPDDTARALAGLPLVSVSPLKETASTPAYEGQVAMFSEMWRRFEERQLSRVRAWADRELPSVRKQSPVLYYIFSGPDIVYANTFFPDCKTYVMCGLEPVGKMPDLLSIPPDKLAAALRRLYGSLDTVLALGFFKTADMGSDFRNPELPGITPVLMTFLSRLGKNLRSVELVAVDRDGNEIPRTAADETAGDLTPGVKIVFDSGQGTPEQTVYYFSANISGEGLQKNPGFANFCRKLEPGAGLVKAASYLMHTSPFSGTRDFLMERCKFILQDDTGIPATVFAESKWQMQPYGRYVRPIKMFSGYYQKKLAEIHRASAGAPLDFGIGYYYSISDCNMLLASRDADSVVVASSTAATNEEFPEKGFISDPDGFTNVRSGPGTEHGIIAVIRQDEPFVFRRDDNSWWRVRTGEGQVGFVHSSRITTARVAATSSSPTQEPASAVVAAPPEPAADAVVVAANTQSRETKSPRKKLIELEAEELRIRNDERLSKKERMEKLRAIWKQQLEVMGKKAA